MIFFDLVQTVLESAGYPTVYVRNITDIDDKIIARCQRDEASPKQLTQRFIDAMWQDEAALGINQPTHQPRATEYVEQMITWIERLLEAGYAYVGDNNDVYYRISKFESYGCLSGRSVNQLVAGSRVDADPFKEQPLDFVLWKQSKENEPFWESPWGRGRPGWHLECTVMSQSLLGETIDIHGGGHDLCFPHHENEIAQAEPLTKKRFVNHWMHVGHVEIDREKMSKSKGNFFLIRDVLKQYTPSEVRFFMLMSHYRHPVNFSEDNWLSARNALSKIHRVCDDYLRSHRLVLDNGFIPQACWDAMLDDFNTPKVFAILFEIIKLYDQASHQQDSDLIDQCGRQVVNITEWLGLSVVSDIAVDATLVDSLIQKRSLARASRDWQQADEIRERLSEMGIVIEDQSTGTIWRVDRRSARHDGESR
tara:strand:+ start:4247 stop:5512 length:1266 start_codon:yes stop_codon:yes gene_type:complete